MAAACASWAAGQHLSSLGGLATKLDRLEKQAALLDELQEENERVRWFVCVTCCLPKHLLCSSGPFVAVAATQVVALGAKQASNFASTMAAARLYGSITCVLELSRTQRWLPVGLMYDMPACCLPCSSTYLEPATATRCCRSRSLSSSPTYLR